MLCPFSIRDALEVSEWLERTPKLLTCFDNPTNRLSIWERLFDWGFPFFMMIIFLELLDQLLFFVTTENKKRWQILHFPAKCFWSVVNALMNALPLHPSSHAFARLVRSWKAKTNECCSLTEFTFLTKINHSLVGCVFFSLWPKWKTYCSESAVQTELPKPFINKETVVYQTSGVDVNYNN